MVSTLPHLSIGKTFIVSLLKIRGQVAERAVNSIKLKIATTGIKTPTFTVRFEIRQLLRGTLTIAGSSILKYQQ